MTDKRLRGVRPTNQAFCLKLIWRDGTETVDLSGLVAASRQFNVFAGGPDAFSKVQVDNWGHAVVWENGLDYSSENLARIANEQATKNACKMFLRWQESHDLTNDEVGDVLGDRKSQIKNFRSGASAIPNSVRMAIGAFEANPTMFYAHYRPGKKAVTRRKKPAVG